MVFVQREHVIATTKASSTDTNQLANSEEEKRKVEAQRNKLDEAKRCFEEGHRLCWKFQDSHSVSKEHTNLSYDKKLELSLSYSTVFVAIEKIAIYLHLLLFFPLTDDFTSLRYTIFVSF